MTDMKPAKSAAEIQPLVRYTPEETARNKKAPVARGLLLCGLRYR